MLHWRKVDKSGLYAPFLEAIELFFHTLPYDFYVTEAFRTLDQSRVGYAAYMAGQGPRYAPPYKSAHNYGLAIDVVLDSSDNPGLQPSWNSKLAGWLALKAGIIGSNHLNHLWRIGDWPHVESNNWKELIHFGEASYYEADLRKLGIWKPLSPSVIV